MNYLIKTMYVVLIALCTVQGGYAQEVSHIMERELPEFKEIQMETSGEVILKRSHRNFMTLQGDSASLEQIEILEDEGRLALVVDEQRIPRIVIEYKSLQSLSAGGAGYYIIQNANEKVLNIFNPLSTVSIHGYAKELRLTSYEGLVDLSNASIKEEQLILGQLAQVIRANDNVRFISYSQK